MRTIINIPTTVSFTGVIMLSLIMLEYIFYKVSRFKQKHLKSYKT